MKILVLTDHQTHTAQNSFYGIVNALHTDSRVDRVGIASRSVIENSAFFNGLNMSKIICSEVDTEIAFPLPDEMIETGVWSSLSDFDLIWLRLPWPVPNLFFEEMARSFPQHRIINDPMGILKTSDKSYLCELVQWTPPVAVCNNEADIVNFKSRYSCVLKPRQSYGGKGMIKMVDEKVWVENEETSVDEFLSEYRKHPISYLAMQYMDRVEKGDKRIVVANGRVLAASLRTPAPGGWLCNVSQGGDSWSAGLSVEEERMVSSLSPILKKEGIFLYGMDTLEDNTGIRRLSEINTLSVGGIVPSSNQTGMPVTDWLVNELFRYIID